MYIYIYILYKYIAYLALKTIIVQNNTQNKYTIGLAAAAAAAAAAAVEFGGVPQAHEWPPNAGWLSTSEQLVMPRHPVMLGSEWFASGATLMVAKPTPLLATQSMPYPGPPPQSIISCSESLVSGCPAVNLRRCRRSPPARLQAREQRCRSRARQEAREPQNGE